LWKVDRCGRKAIIPMVLDGLCKCFRTEFVHNLCLPKVMTFL